MSDRIFKYSTFAKLFCFPHKEFVNEVRDIQAYLDATHPQVGEDLRPFTECMAELPLHEIEDLFLRSFEVQAVTTLDIAYVIFGDDYKRGEFLVNLNKEHSKYGIDCGNELADHLPNVLRLMDVLEDEELMRDLVGKILLPALTKMIAGFGENEMAARDKVYKKHHKTLLTKHQSFTIYQQALETLRAMLEVDFAIRPEGVLDHSAGFLHSITEEIELSNKPKLTQLGKARPR